MSRRSSVVNMKQKLLEFENFGLNNSNFQKKDPLYQRINSNFSGKHLKRD